MLVEKWLGENRRECGEDAPGICRGFGICYCDPTVHHCQCVLQEHLQDEDYENFNLQTNITQRGITSTIKTTSYDIISVLFSSSVVFFVQVVWLGDLMMQSVT